MFNSFRQLFSRAKAAPHLPTDSTMAYYLSPDGKLSPIGGTKSAVTSYSDLSGWIRAGGALDGSDAELPYSEDGYAYAVATSVWAYNCVELRARKVADIMRKAGRVIDSASGKVIDGHPLMTGLHAAWHRYRQDVFYEWQYNRCVFGENYTEKVCAEVYSIHIPMALRVINPLQIEPLIESLILAFERREISIFNHPVLLSELGAYERKVSSTGRSQYSAPAGLHDDCVMSLALAWYGITNQRSAPRLVEIDW